MKLRWGIPEAVLGTTSPVARRWSSPWMGPGPPPKPTPGFRAYNLSSSRGPEYLKPCVLKPTVLSPLWVYSKPDSTLLFGAVQY